MSKTKKTGVIGFPVDHSLSPTIHNYWIKKYSVNTQPYTKISINPKNYDKIMGFDGEMMELREKGYEGLNVTVPFKEEAFGYSDPVNEEAARTYAVNTLTFNVNEAGAVGDNTDVVGFLNSLNQKIIEEKILNKDGIVLGAGGAARAVVFALTKLDCRIRIYNRTVSKAEDLSYDLRSPDVEGKNRVSVISTEESLRDFSSSAGFIINTTSLGLDATDKNDLIDFGVVNASAHAYDLIYKPTKTNFLKEAEKRGLSIQNGMDMLIEQAAESFQIWHNLKPKKDRKLTELLEKQ